FIVNFALVQFLDEGQMIQLDVVETIIQVFAIVVIPVTIGMLIRKYKEAFAMRMARPVRIASGIVLALVIIGILIKENEKIISYFQQAGIVTLCLNVATMLVGFYSAKIFNIKNEQAVSISIESGIQNGTLAISIAVVLLGSTAFSIAPAIYSLIMFTTGGAVIWLSLRRLKKK
ncbi:MAG: bile acid:sodium symporter family protein, partial [Draconibacterium sp.]|nr:bile acid:sodium symporter family protein [Draconibacterium sp.]